MAETGELGMQFPVVEDLAVVTQNPSAVRRDPRLRRAFPVHDPQPLRAREQAVLQEDLFDLAARRQRLDHPAECAHSVGTPGRGSRRCRTYRVQPATSGSEGVPQPGGRARADAHVPGLSLVDDVDISLGLALEQQLPQGAVGAEPAEP